MELSQMINVVSSNIYSIGYDVNDNTLYVMFTNDSIYAYYNVEQRVYNNLLKASSLGSFLAREVKGVYRYQKLNNFSAPSTSDQSTTLLAKQNISKKEVVDISTTSNTDIDNHSLYELGKVYYEGDFYIKNILKASKLFRISAENGHMQSQYLLGLIYLDTYDDVKTALSYFKLASNQGSKDASWEIYCIFDTDDWGVKDIKEAKYWMTIASNQGHFRAKKLLNLYANPTVYRQTNEYDTYFPPCDSSDYESIFDDEWACLYDDEWI